jgi:hypothetical protein
MPSLSLFKLYRLILAAMALIAVMGVASLFVSHRAQAAPALCAVPPEEGSWVNTDPNTRSITRVQVKMVDCNDTNTNNPEYRVHLYGACHPSNCDWGSVSGRRLKTGEIYAFYDQGFAKRDVFIRMSKYRAGQLWVAVRTTFTDGRSPYDSQDWFTKQ